MKNSVLKMKRQEEREDLNDGFWYQLVESIDEGHLTTNEVGVQQRGEFKLQEIGRKLQGDRQRVLDKVSIRERAFAFHRESVGLYLGILSTLEEDIRKSRVAVVPGTEGLKRSAKEGEAVIDLKLDPVAERYLALRLADECHYKWIPEAQKQYDYAKQGALAI